MLASNSRKISSADKLCESVVSEKSYGYYSHINSTLIFVAVTNIK